ncbi:MAG TPA: hypothetical protein VEK57_20050 [Thermoanaerobaculia bacterium]|nr:hypothetical protein [Thermoanaerobaculia bacterium]
MPPFQININIDSTGVKQINDNAQYITFVKNVTSNPLSTGNLQVAWLAFSPFKLNQVSWTQDYSIYATTTQIQAGAQIVMTSQTDAFAQLGPIYQFAQGIFTTGPQGSANTFNTQNNWGTSLTFGLAQQATVNGAAVMAPLNAVRIGNAQQGSFTPIETISLYLSSFSNNGTVISQVAGTALTVQLTTQQPVANLGFNNGNNSFFLVNQTTAANALSITSVALGDMPSTSTANASRQLS